MSIKRYTGIVCCVIVLLAMETNAQSSADSVNLFSKKFKSASSISIDPFGSMYIADAGTNEIFKYDSNGVFKFKIGGTGWGGFSFDHPADIATPNGLDVYIADYGNHRIQRLDRNLNKISTLQMHDADEPAKRFGYSSGIALDRYGALYVLDGENARVVKIRGNKIETTFGGVDAGKGMLHNPKAICIGPDDLAYVLDGEHINVYDIFGNFIHTTEHDAAAPKIQAIGWYGSSLLAMDSCTVYLLKNYANAPMQLEKLSAHASFSCNPVDVALFRGWLYILTRTSIAKYPKPAEPEKN